jgi:phage terminase large subunit-like protein
MATAKRRTDYPPEVQIGVDYAVAVAAGTIPAGIWVRKACRRFVIDLKKSAAGESRWIFDPRFAILPILLAGQLTNIKGPEAGRPIALLPFQHWIIINIYGFVERLSGTRRFRQASIWIPRGNGKALALDTEIATPDGFKTMGEVEPGDIVIDRDGQPVPVIATTPIMLGRPCYEVEFDTGEIIVADGEHRWLTQDTNERDTTRRHNRQGYSRNRGAAPSESAKTTKRIAATLEYGKPHPRHGKRQKNHRVRVAAALDLPEVDLPIDPYVLGYWLGDGTSAGASVTVGDDDAATFEVEMALCSMRARRQRHRYQLGFVEQASLIAGGLFKRHRHGAFQLALRELGVLGNKHIPPIYLRASAAQRLALLQGLMDSDGHISSGQGQCELTTISEKLAAGYLELIASLGFRPTITPGRARIGKRDISPKFRIFFHAYADQPPCRLPRKRAQLRKRGKFGYQNNRMIVAVRPVVSQPVKCIQTASSTYLVGRTFTPTHNSTLVSVLALCSTFLEEEGGAEGYTAAVSRDQAKIVFDFCKAMTRANASFRKEFGITVREHALHQNHTASRLMAISSDAKALDGLNVHFGVLDEIASHRSKAVYDVIITAMVKRRQPLIVSISTATDNVTGIGKQVWDYSEKVLDGLADERFFAVMYAAEEDDDPWDEATWAKANPGYPRLVQPEALRSAALQAQASPALKAAFLTRHLNVWVGADQALFDLGYWDRCAKPEMSIDEFEGQPCFAAIDMATRIDIAAGSVIFPYREEGQDQVRYAIFHRAWLPEAAVDPMRNPAYVEWVDRGFLEVTEGETTDYDGIEAWLREVARRFDLRSCAYDPYALMQFSQRARNEGLPMVEYRATTLNFSEPTKMLDALMRERRLDHDGSPVARWCIGNVVGHYDRRGNVYPNKPRLEAKIDCAITDIMALGVSLAADQEQQYIYAGDKELLVF